MVGTLDFGVILNSWDWTSEALQVFNSLFSFGVFKVFVGKKIIIVLFEMWYMHGKRLLKKFITKIIKKKWKYFILKH